MRSVKELMNLEGQTVLITGGAGHIGSVMAEALAECGANIVLLDTDLKKLELSKKRLSEKFKTNIDGIVADLENENEIREVFSNFKNKSLDVLIHCAALVGTSELVGWNVPFAEQDITTWRRALEVNLTAVFLLTQVCLPYLNRSENASVININSIYGIAAPDLTLYEGTDMGSPAAYAASKGGLIQLTKAMASHLGPKIRVNSISLGGIERGQEKEFVKKYNAKTFLKRMGTEEDIKGAAVYLASNMSAYVTGHNLVIDGGWSV